MPVHNGAKFLRAAIDSVLGQTFTDLELLVIDDDSSDDSVAIARAYTDPRLRSMSGHGRRGLPGTLNIGLRAAAGAFIARLDQDDVAHPDRIEKQVAWLERKPEVPLVGSLARLIDEDGRPIGTVQRPVSAIAIRWYSLIENPLIHSTAMFRRDAVLALGGYDETLPLAEDYDLWGRVLESHTVENIDDYLIDYRRVSGSMMTAVESETAGPRRQRLIDIMRTLIARRINTELGEPFCNDTDSALLASFTLGVDRRRWREFLRLLTQLRRRFETKWRAARDDADYWRTVARQYDAIAFRMTPASRLAAAGVYAHACVEAPRAAARVPWLRAGALMLLGRRGRQWVANQVAAVST